MFQVTSIMIVSTILILFTIGGTSSSSSSSQLFPVPSLVEVVFEGGSAHATSEIPDGWTADKAFIRGRGHSKGWHNNGEILPSMVWYDFPASKAFIPGRISFRGRQDCCPLDAPTMWQFVGSNDEICSKSGHWTVLCEDKSNSGYPHKAFTKYCDVDEKILTQFRCLGVSVLNSGQVDSNTALRNVRMWKKVYL